MSFNKHMDEFLEDYDPEEHEDILETAKAISSDDKTVMKQIKLAVDDPRKYCKQNMERFDERGIDLEDDEFLDELDHDELLWLAMVDELEANNYAFEFDWKCELKDFLWGLEQLKNYSLIADAVKTISFDESNDIEAWGKELNIALGGKIKICYLDIDSDSYPIAIITAEAFESIPVPMVIAI